MPHGGLAVEQIAGRLERICGATHAVSLTGGRLRVHIRGARPCCNTIETHNLAASDRDRTGAALVTELTALRAVELAALDIFKGCPAEDLMPLAASLQPLEAGAGRS